MIFNGCLKVPDQIILDPSTVKQALEIAIQQIGKPYVFGSRGPNEFDCSGLIVWSYKQVYPKLKLRIGNRLVDDANIDELWKYNIHHVDNREIKPGDIMFITGNKKTITHGGLFLRWIEQGSFEYINASSYYEHEKVVIDTFPLNGTKRDQWYIGAGRLKTSYKTLTS